MSLQDNNNHLIVIDNISIEREGRQVLTDVSMTVNKGDFIAITGPNGGGKTTLIRIMLKLLKPDRGYVKYSCGIDGALRIGYLPQKKHDRFPLSHKCARSCSIRIARAKEHNATGKRGRSCQSAWADRNDWPLTPGNRRTVGRTTSTSTSRARNHISAGAACSRRTLELYR